MNENRIEYKRKKEQETAKLMIEIYCRGNHRQDSGNKLCPNCAELLEYVRIRSEKCPFMENKTFCSNCRVHCYQPKRREEIRKVMRYSGPRMLLRRPGLALWHVICSTKEKRKNGE